MPKRSIFVDIAWCHQKKKLATEVRFFGAGPQLIRSRAILDEILMAVMHTSDEALGVR